MKRIAMAVLVNLFGLGGGTVFGQTLRVPFDFSQSEIGIDATVNGAPMQLLGGENWPLIPQLRLGEAAISATLDTGSSSSIVLYDGALEMPGVRSALVEKGEVKAGGFQGEEKREEYVFNKPSVSLGLSFRRVVP